MTTAGVISSKGELPMSIPLLPTKLYTPLLRADRIRRPWLTDKLIAAGPRPLIAAPTDFGKTILVSIGDND
jgi:ATP/maltotriose-dependent transcriptional regulator MalT